MNLCVHVGLFSVIRYQSGEAKEEKIHKNYSDFIIHITERGVAKLTKNRKEKNLCFPVDSKGKQPSSLPSRDSELESYNGSQ